ncbi:MULTISPECIES: DUF3597 domain-containing protein [Brevundimonas]|uniref:Domain of uncharacterized function (DUF3597) n=1 Tax=Brevundimonas vesicularis TaxID=41276 RepID=A0A2X1CJU0_BREVE|nr:MULTISPECIES: DUF3597 domain-containing protein [Brevundimonas]SPU54471.1 Domain of uncharacterised function (DUF3597) [Brevundimonas vesicularis]
MSFFGRIWDKITGHKARPTTPQAQAPTSTPVSAQPVPAAPTTPFTPQPVDVDQILSQMAEMKGGGGNWRTSIVDLLKLLDLDSSLDARKDLAEELGVHAGAHGSAEQNIALSKAVWRKLAENGGQVPASLRD